MSAPDASAPDVREVLAGEVVWDNHACMPLRIGDERFLPEIERHRAAGVDVVSLNVGYGQQGPKDHLAMLAQFRAWFSARPDHYVLARTPGDIRAAKAAGKLAVVFDVEGMNAVGDQPSLVHAYYALGVRWMLVAYNRPNRAGGGCLTPDDPGLSDFGRAVIAEMERAGMLLCCSHTGWRTAAEAIEASRAPVILSHSNAHALWPHPRNAPDELILACAKTGGVVGINGIGQFLGPGPASAETMAGHVEHALKLVGEDHVSIGLDYCFDRKGTAAHVRAMYDSGGPHLGFRDGLTMLEPEALPVLAAVLLERGHAARTVRKVMGGNLMRLAEQVWR